MACQEWMAYPRGSPPGGVGCQTDNMVLFYAGVTTGLGGGLISRLWGETPETLESFQGFSPDPTS